MGLELLLAPVLGASIGLILARAYIEMKFFIQSRNLNHVFAFDPDGHTAAASYDMKRNQIVHRFKYYNDINVERMEEKIEMMILWAELEELTHWAGHCDVEPGHSNDWLFSLLDVCCYIHDSCCYVEMGDRIEVLGEYPLNEVVLEA